MHVPLREESGRHPRSPAQRQLCWANMSAAIPRWRQQQQEKLSARGVSEEAGAGGVCESGKINVRTFGCKTRLTWTRQAREHETRHVDQWHACIGPLLCWQTPRAPWQDSGTSKMTRGPCHAVCRRPVLQDAFAGCGCEPCAGMRPRLRTKQCT